LDASASGIIEISIAAGAVVNSEMAQLSFVSMFSSGNRLICLLPYRTKIELFLVHLENC
jgi:hypothetical protein